MTKRLSDLTPEEAEIQRAKERERRLKYRDATYRAKEAARHKHKYATDPAYRARKDQAANEARLKSTYGITSKERDKMLANQNGRCAICGTDKPGGRNWHIDHCHTTKKVRSLLCTSCNVFLGRIEANPQLVEKIYTYIEGHRA